MEVWNELPVQPQLAFLDTDQETPRQLLPVVMHFLKLQADTAYCRVGCVFPWSSASAPEKHRQS
ncbi:hypothetical protein DB31_1825 [Hyalangium minutum]|uniref:Uncharacterized protein n=1 Tax=Hyalangium minutum TaxID=394096 RepID=A0A085WAU4_9BACT|nr:hypothetical protein DB31_1825 [Hyalangium minutum]